MADSNITFESLGVSKGINDKLQELGITSPFEIQALSIADLIARRDVVGRAPTGSGKTLAFGIPLAMCAEKASKKRPTGLILAPTRELADQIAKELRPLLAVRDLDVLPIFGGTGFDRQLRALRKGVDVVVATPGRLMDLMNQKEIFLDDVETVIVDEADRMSDMGFFPEVVKIVDKTSETRQTVLFSATLGDEVKTLIKKYQHDPLYCEVGPESPDLTKMTHRFIKVNNENRLAVAAKFAQQAHSSIVFCRTKHGCNRLARQLQNAGLSTGLIHGDRSQNQRTAALKRFASGDTNVLVATDVAARGIHVDNVDQVIHFDPPKEDSTYVHRSGRTARAGAEGVVVSLIKPNENKQSKRMRKNLEIDVEAEDAPEIDLDEFIKTSKERSLKHDEKDRVAKRRRSPKNRSGGRNGGSRGGGKGKGRSNSRSRNRSDDDERSDRPSRGRYKKDGERSSKSGSGKPRRSKHGGSRNRSDEDGERSSRSGSGKPRRSSKPGGKPGSKPGGRNSKPKSRDGKPGRPKGKDGKPKSKRTGKPRPKNKNSRSARSKPKTRRT